MHSSTACTSYACCPVWGPKTSVQHKSLGWPLQGKRKGDDMSELSRGTSCDTSRPSDLMDDARCKKQKVNGRSAAQSLSQALTLS